MTDTETKTETETKKVAPKEYTQSKGLAIILIVLLTTIGGFIGIGIGSLFKMPLLAGIIAIIIAFLGTLALCLVVVNQWEKVIVLRLGNYAGTLGPGIHLIVPIIDSAYQTVSMRVGAELLESQSTLTKDNVEVQVDAVVFAKVTSAEDAVFTVSNYYQTMLKAAQTALRDTIGSMTLQEATAGRASIGKTVHDTLNEHIKDYGLEATDVQIRDISIPPALQDAISRKVQAEQEKNARVELAEAEVLTAQQMKDAAAIYQSDPAAMQLRALNMMYEMSLNGKNQIIFIPTESKGFGIPTPVGVMGVAAKLGEKIEETPSKEEPKSSENTE